MGKVDFTKPNLKRPLFSKICKKIAWTQQRIGSTIKAKNPVPTPKNKAMGILTYPIYFSTGYSTSSLPSIPSGIGRPKIRQSKG